MVTPHTEEVSADAVAWLRGRTARICDVQEPWSHGTVLRSTAHPEYYDYNHVRVEREDPPDAATLQAVADEALAGLAHRRLDFEHAAAAEAVAPVLAADGWDVTHLVLLRHTTGTAPATAVALDEVAYEDVTGLRAAWHEEDFPGQPVEAYLEQARAVATALGTRTLAVHRDGVPVAFADLEARDGAAEITSVYVGPEHRGGGLGTALTCAAIAAAGRPRALWIAADEGARAQHLYRRLGFADALRFVSITRWPAPR